MKLLSFGDGLGIGCVITLAFGAPLGYLIQTNGSQGDFLLILDAYLVVLFVLSPLLAIAATKRPYRSVGGAVRYTLAALIPLTFTAFLLFVMLLASSVATAS